MTEEKTDSKVYFGEQLKEFLSRHFLTLSKIAQSADISSPSFYNLLSGKTRKPRPDTLRRLEGAINKQLAGSKRAVSLGKDEKGIFFEVKEIEFNIDATTQDASFDRAIQHITGEDNLDKEVVEDVKAMMRLLAQCKSSVRKSILSVLEETRNPSLK